MRFLLYNIRYAAGIGRKFHLPVPYSGYFKNTNGNFKKIVDFIKSLNPDILGLIEVDAGSFRSAKSNQAEAIAQELKHFHIYQSKYSTASMVQKVPVLNKQGNAILTNQRIVSQNFHYFSNGVKRLVIELELKDVSIFLVHLSIKFRHRQYQLQDLHNMIKNLKKPVIISMCYGVIGSSNYSLPPLSFTMPTATGNPPIPAEPREDSSILFFTARKFTSPIFRYHRSNSPTMPRWYVILRL